MEPPLQDTLQTVVIDARDPAALCRALNSAASGARVAAVILHYVGYGYTKRGAPVWLLRAVRQWRHQNANVPLVGLFHELFAFGRPWRSSFWLHPAQRHIARMLWQLCDYGVTTNTMYLDQLCRWRPEAGDRLRLMPVFSTVGEPGGLRPPGERPARAAVFGSPGIESQLYRTLVSDLAALLERLEIEEICDIGARRSPVPASIGPAKVIAHGRLPAEEISGHLEMCRYGLMTYDTARLGKSTIFAAYAAHGIIPVSMASSGQAMDGLAPGRHFLTMGLEAAPTAPELSRIQVDLRSWYRPHNMRSLTACIAAIASEASSSLAHV